MSTDAIIAISGVSFSFGETEVLRDVSLNVEEGDFACVVGPNGGGKTTLLRLFLGLLSPDRGTVQVMGKKPTEARKRIGYMPQSSHLDPRFPVTVMDVVQMGRLGTRTIWGPFRHADRVAAERCLEDVGMNGHESRPLSALSGGQRQRVLLARALACDPRLLLLDEPTSNVDVAAQDDLYKLLERLNERMTVMLVTHDLGVVAGSFKTAICVNKNVHVHSTSALSGDALRDLYERDVRVVQHDDHEHCDHGDGDHLGGGHRLQAGDRHG